MGLIPSFVRGVDARLFTRKKANARLNSGYKHKNRRGKRCFEKLLNAGRRKAELLRMSF